MAERGVALVGGRALTGPPPEGWVCERVRPAVLRRGFLVDIGDGRWGEVSAVFSGGVTEGDHARVVRVWVSVGDHAEMLACRPGDRLLSARPFL